MLSVDQLQEPQSSAQALEPLKFEYCMRFPVPDPTSLIFQDRKSAIGDPLVFA
jgi:hypothetical protein